jgi:hypothetical protein
MLPSLAKTFLRGSPVKAFEYKVLIRRAQEDDLNELGKEGWELVAVLPDGKMYFKREIEQIPTQG